MNDPISKSVLIEAIQEEIEAAKEQGFENTDYEIALKVAIGLTNAQPTYNLQEKEPMVSVKELKYAISQLTEFVSNVALHNPDAKVILVDELKDAINDWKKESSK